MDYKAELKTQREKIDRLDSQLVELFNGRMDIAGEIAKIKQNGNMSILDTNREREVIDNAVRQGTDDKKEEIAAFMSNIIALSKLRQTRVLKDRKPLLFPESAAENTEKRICHQGIPGAYGEIAARQLFPDCTPTGYEEFEDVFVAVKNGDADFGVLPIENSKTGAIGEVYDLLRKFGCYITGQIWIGVNHCLLVPDGTKLEDIREVYSHSEGFRQCSHFLKNKSWDKMTTLNTAVAVKSVADKNSVRCAAIGSRRAAEIWGLSILVSDIMDDNQNRTRFIVIAREPHYNESSDTISLTFSTPHVSGALSGVLQIFALSGVNLKRIESRPVSNGKYRFFADIEGNITDGNIVSALERASVQCEYFEVLGCYQ